MPAGHGLRSRTRDSFSRPFRGKGFIPLSTYLRTYKLGDYVDIKVNSAVHKVREEGGGGKGGEREGGAREETGGEEAAIGPPAAAALLPCG